MTTYLVRLDVVTPPSAPVVDVPTMRQHLRLDSKYDDNLIAAYTLAATELIEGWIGRPLLQTTFQYAISRQQRQIEYPLVPVPLLVLPLSLEWIVGHDFSRNVLLPRNPVTAVNSVSLSFWDGSPDQELVLGTDYEIDIGNEPGRVHFCTYLECMSNSRLNINFTAGYTPSTVPQNLKIAVMMLTAHIYESRTGGDDIPKVVESLIASNRMWSFGLA